MSPPRRGAGTRIIEALAASREVDATRIRVDVAGGVALLRGRVHSHAERLAARVIAGQVEGVVLVDNRLEVHRSEDWRLSDESVAEGVAAALSATVVPLAGVDAVVRQHVVTLRGRVATPEYRRMLHHALAEIAGVDFVDDELEVDPAHAEAVRGGEQVDEADAWRLIRRRDLGRLAVRRDEGVDIFPVNYLVGPRSVYFRSGPGAKLELLAAHSAVAFEVDGGRGSSRWSVVLRGVARRLDSDVEIESSGVARLETWDTSEKLNYVCLDIDTVTGRRFAHPG